MACYSEEGSDGEKLAAHPHLRRHRDPVDPPGAGVELDLGPHPPAMLVRVGEVGEHRLGRARHAVLDLDREAWIGGHVEVPCDRSSSMTRSSLSRS